MDNKTTNQRHHVNHEIILWDNHYTEVESWIDEFGKHYKEVRFVDYKLIAE